MKKILVLSELECLSCIVCASIYWTLFEELKIEVKFSSQEKFVDTTNDLGSKIDDYDLIVGIGYNKHLRITQGLSYKDKLLVLCPSELEYENEFTPIIFGTTLPKNLELITTIVETANGQINKNIFFNQEEDDDELNELIGEPKSDIDESLYCLWLRYDRALKVVKSIYGEKEIIKFHKYFWSEMIKQEEMVWIEKLLDKHELMEENTNKLIKSINPLEKTSCISFIHSEDICFFKDELIMASEQQGYLASAIEYKNDCGQYMTIYAQKYTKRTAYLFGQVRDNRNLIVSSLN